MRRVTITPRFDYIQKIEDLGFNFHTDYWKENAYYAFTEKEIESIEEATRECYDMMCEAVEYIITNKLFKQLHIPEELVPAIIESWDSDKLSLYGRFDFAFIDGVPKLLEFNADTPTSLLEASVIQWHWKEDKFPMKDQFNSIHENLVQSWKDIHNIYNCNKYHFICVRDSVEDQETLQYIISTAMEAGLDTVELDMSQFNLEDFKFFDPGNEVVECCFKLYPWEWMMNESVDGCLADVLWIEPMWKSMMSNKAILPILYKLFPNSPYTLPCDYNPIGKSYCKKPIFSREGANVELVKDGKVIEASDGEYGEEGFIYQELVDIPSFDDKYPILGSWVIGGVPAGMGIRETSSRITDNMSEFIPHIIL